MIADRARSRSRGSRRAWCSVAATVFLAAAVALAEPGTGVGRKPATTGPTTAPLAWAVDQLVVGLGMGTLGSREVRRPAAVFDRPAGPTSGPVVSAPKAAPAPSSTAAVAVPVHPRLAQRLPELILDKVPLSDALNFIRNAADLNLFVDRRALDVAGVDVAIPVSVSLRDISVDQAFRYVGRAAAPPGTELGTQVEGDIVIFTVLRPAMSVNVDAVAAAAQGPGDLPVSLGLGGVPAVGPGWADGEGQSARARPADAEKAVTRVYSVDALVGDRGSDRLDELTGIITGSLAVDEGSLLVGVRPFNGKLVVTATPDLQEQVQGLIAMLHDQAPAAPPAPAPAPATAPTPPAVPAALAKAPATAPTTAPLVSSTPARAPAPTPATVSGRPGSGSDRSVAVAPRETVRLRAPVLSPALSPVQRRPSTRPSPQPGFEFVE